MKNSKEPIIIAALHFPLYGRCNPSKSIGEIEEYALTNAKVFVENGISSVIIQDENPNMGPATPETLAVMSSIGRLLKREIPGLNLGIIIQSHDGISPIAIAHACGADFVRIKVFSGIMIKAEGMQQGVGVEAVNYRTMIGSNVKIWADAHDRMGYPLLPNIDINTIVSWVNRAGADGIVVTGKSYPQTIEYLKSIEKMNITKPIIVGGSVNENNILEVLNHCEGAVVSSSLMLDGSSTESVLHWDAEKIKRFMDKVNHHYK